MQRDVHRDVHRDVQGKRWAIPFHPSATMLSVQGTADRLAGEQNGVWTGEPVEKLCSEWFEKPIALDE